MKTLWPNYHKGITNVANSILKYFNCKTYHETLEVLDKYLEKDYQNVILILYDGMGSNLMERNLKEDSFLRRHQIDTIHSVFPPTTTASTTSVITGLYPKEHGWLGWDLYFKEEDKIVTMFRNTLKDSLEQASDCSLANKYYGYTSIINLINEKYQAYELYSFKDKDYRNLEERNEKVLELTKKEGKKFIYVYDEQPDYSMHELGTNHPNVVSIFESLDRSTEELCSQLEDSLVIIVADHGLINSSVIYLSNYSDIFSLLRKNISIEARTCSFFIKEGKEQEFESLFQKHFGNNFELYTKQEVIDKNLFGIGEEHVRFQDALGDYLAVAISDKFFRYDEKGDAWVAMHAGITEDEVLIPLIICEKEKNLD